MYIMLVCLSVIQVIIFIRAHHKHKEHICKFKLHIINVFFNSENILCLFITLWLFWSKQVFRSQSDLFFYHLCVFGVFLFMVGTFGL